MTPAQYNEYQRQADIIEQAKKWKEEQENKQMTSIEWLYNNLKSHFEHDGDLLEVVKMSFDQGKEMHKQEIMRAFIDGEENVWDRKNEGHEFQYDNHEHYYTEKFNSDSKGSDTAHDTSSPTQHNSPKVESKTSSGEVSDDEIEKQADVIDSGMHRMFFIAGARWYREQLKQEL